MATFGRYFIVAAFVSQIAAGATENAISVLEGFFSLVGAGDVAEVRAAEDELVRVIDEAPPAERSYLVKKVFELSKHPDEHRRVAAARTLSKLTEPWQVDPQAQSIEYVYNQFKAEFNPVAKTSLEQALMNASGMLRSCLVISMTDFSSSKKAIACCKNVAAYSASEYSVRALLFAAQGYIRLWMMSDYQDRRHLQSAIDEYNLALAPTLLQASEGGVEVEERFAVLQGARSCSDRRNKAGHRRLESLGTVALGTKVGRAYDKRTSREKGQRGVR